MFLYESSKPGLILGLLGVAKLALDNMGISIPDELMNDIANGFSAVLVVISIFTDYGKSDDSQA